MFTSPAPQPSQSANAQIGETGGSIKKKTMGNRRHLSAVLWRFSTAASDTQCKRVFVASADFSNRPSAVRRTLHLAAFHIVFVKHIPKIYSISFKSLLTIPGLALPCIAFIVWPTRNPIAFSLPAL